MNKSYIKRIFALVVTTVILFSVTACSKGGRKIIEVTLSTEDYEAILAAAGVKLPDAETCSSTGTTVKWLSWEDDFHNYSEDEIVNTGYFTFKEKYGCEVEWIETEYNSRYDTLANLILADEAPDGYPGASDTFPTRAIKGIFQSVDEYIDYSDPLWQGIKDYADKYFSLGGKHYTMISNTRFGRVCAYNRRTIDEWGFDDPAELFANYEWTWNRFSDMCIEFSDPDEERYALDGWTWDSAIMASCGTNIIAYNPETGLFESRVDDPRPQQAADVVYNLCKNNCVYPLWQRGWKIRNEVDGGGMNEGKLLFYIEGSWAFTGPVDEISAVWGDVTQNEIMFVPVPRNEHGDGVYYLEATQTAYCIVAGCDNPEGIALLASCERFKQIDPTVIDIDRKQLKETYLWTDEMLEMYDTCMELVSSGDVAIIDYYSGVGDTLDDVSSKFQSFARSSNVSSWAQIKEANQEKFDYYLKELNDSLIEFNKNS